MNTNALDGWDLIPTTDQELAKRQLDEDGLCVVPAVLDDSELADARARLLSQAAGERARALDFRDGGGAGQQLLTTDGALKNDAFTAANGGINQRVWMLVNKGACFRAMVVHPVVTDLVGHVLGTHYLLSTHSANIAKPGGRRMGLHTDQWWMPQPVRPGEPHIRPGDLSRVPGDAARAPDPSLGISPAVVCNVMWMLNDFTVENGATEFVRGTHLSGAQPDPAADGSHDIRQATGTAGSIVVFDGRLWHGTGANDSDHDRLGVLTTFCAPQFRQQENEVLGLHPALFDVLGDELKARLGFVPWNAYGRVENPRDPISPNPHRIGEL